jgi:hypothetical protein
MRGVLGVAAALMFLALSTAPSIAQDKGPASGAVLTSADYVGVWSGVSDWRGVEGYDNASMRWDLRADGTFLDDFNETGTWGVGADGYIAVQYGTGGQARYSGTIIGNVLVGTMTTGEYSGAFAMRR